MKIESTDNAYIVNQKLKNLLNTEDEKQYFEIEKEYIHILRNNTYNEKENSLATISFKNTSLCDVDAFVRIFNNPIFFTASFVLPNREYNFDKRLAKTFFSIVFLGQGDNDNSSDCVKINNLCLPEKIDTFRFQWNDIVENNVITNRILHFWDLEDKDIDIELEVPPNVTNEDGTKVYYNYDTIRFVFDKGW